MELIPEISLPAHTVDRLEAIGRKYGITAGQALGRWVNFLEINGWILEPFYRNMPLGDWPDDKLKIFIEFMEVEMNR